MRDWFEYRRSLDVFLQGSKNLNARERNEVLKKEFGVFGDCTFLINIEDYFGFLDAFLGEFDSNRSRSERDFKKVLDIEQEFNGLIYPVSINGRGSSCEVARQDREYNRGIVLGGATKKYIDVFFELGDFLVDKKIPFFLPRNVGSKYSELNEGSYDCRIVAYFP